MRSRSSVVERLARDLAERAFRGAPTGRVRRIGAEAELIPLTTDTGVPVPISSEGGLSTLPILRRHAVRAGWQEIAGAGAPAFRTPDGGSITFEPGGQIEYSTPPCTSVGALLRSLHGTVLSLRDTAAAEGVSLLGAGLDPVNPLALVPLQLRAPRYQAMDEYFARIGGAGARMMRQSASLQVSLDWEGEVAEHWLLLNRVAPYLTAIFASSPIYEGVSTGHRSHRAMLWRRLDPLRTGIFTGVGDPVREYLEFALRAPTVLKRTAAGDPLPFGEWLVRGDATEEDWTTHLSTLFPEVRPKGFAEIRSIDAIAPELYAAPLVLLAGLSYHRPACSQALEVLGAPGRGLLEQAAIAGLRDPEIARRAADIFAIALAGADAIGPPFCEPAVVDRARGFFEEYTRCGRSPADDAEEPPRESALATG